MSAFMPPRTRLKCLVMDSFCRGQLPAWMVRWLFAAFRLHRQ